MKIREFATNTLVKIGASIFMFLILSMTAMITYSSFDLTSPYFAAAIFFSLQAVAMMFATFVDNFDEYFSPESLIQLSRILSPLKVITASAIIVFANLRDAPVLLLAFVFVFIVWLLATGVAGIVCHWVLPMYQALMQNRTAIKAARSEVALINDLDQYLSKVDIS